MASRLRLSCLFAALARPWSAWAWMGGDQCVKAIGQQCSSRPCPEGAGPTACVNGYCECQPGYCSYEGYCLSSCSSETDGTCEVASCFRSRGAVACVGGKCLCKEGSCMAKVTRTQQVHGSATVIDYKEQECKKQCEKDTKGTCNLFSCASFRGETTCVGSAMRKKCVCKEGFCSIRGRCYPAFNGNRSLALAAAAAGAPAPLDDEEPLDAVAAAALLLVAVGSLLGLGSTAAALRRRRRATSAAAPLLSRESQEHEVH
eukprot:TRINITY_DN30565_c0_g1_i1.p1 TRINITY_DN30565_c0_g1~~TRINITY_DN30565_c0_g1_i1.p1  ORF type:complete len:277 (+),score=61.12 TRINITY_DN30565_c0_g1_i1:55-831(+)